MKVRAPYQLYSWITVCAEQKTLERSPIGRGLRRREGCAPPEIRVPCLRRSGHLPQFHGPSPDPGFAHNKGEKRGPTANFISSRSGSISRPLTGPRQVPRMRRRRFRCAWRMGKDGRRTFGSLKFVGMFAFAPCGMDQLRLRPPEYETASRSWNSVRELVQRA